MVNHVKKIIENKQLKPTIVTYNQLKSTEGNSMQLKSSDYSQLK